MEAAPCEPVKKKKQTLLRGGNGRHFKDSQRMPGKSRRGSSDKPKTAELSMAPAVRLPPVQEEGKPLCNAGTVAMNYHKMPLFLHQFKMITLLGVQCQ